MSIETLRPDALILGIDPAIDTGKLMAMVLVHFHDGIREAINWCDGRVQERAVKDRLSVWLAVLRAMLHDAKERVGHYPDMVAIEDVRARGRGGSHLETLVTCLREDAQSLGVRCERINPMTVKKEATGNGHADTETVALIVRSEYRNMGRVPVAGEYDTEMAAAIAGAGYAIMQAGVLEART